MALSVVAQGQHLHDGAVTLSPAAWKELCEKDPWGTLLGASSSAQGLRVGCTVEMYLCPAPRLVLSCPWLCSIHLPSWLDTGSELLPQTFLIKAFACSWLPFLNLLWSSLVQGDMALVHGSLPFLTHFEPSLGVHLSSQNCSSLTAHHYHQKSGPSQWSTCTR